MARASCKALGCMIEPGDASYMIFLCGNSMTNLAGEMEKAAAHTTTGVIKRYNIDAVCSPVLDAVVFDLTDAVTAAGSIGRSHSSGSCSRRRTMRS